MIQLYRNRVAITPIFDRDTSASGRIIIPEEARDRCDQGIVKYIGPEVRDLKIGDYVLFSGYSGDMVRLEDEGKLIIMPETQVQCVLLEPPTIEVPGLYHRDASSGEYFPATSEQAFELIAEAYTHSGHAYQVHGPRRNEYE